MAKEFSPELALVDPELAALLRASLPDPSDCLARRPCEPAPVVATVSVARAVPDAEADPIAPVAAPVARGGVAPTGPAQDRRTPVPHRRPAFLGWRRVKRTASVLVLLGIVGLPFVAFGSPDYPGFEDSSAPTSAGTEREPSPSQLPASKVGMFAGPRVEQLTDRRRRVLSWPEVRKATLYNVVFVSGKRRVDRWVTGTSTTVRTRATGQRPSAVPLLVYRWYVYPLYREHGGVRFGKLLAQGSIRLPQDALRG
jgi:hypothetical protein